MQSIEQQVIDIYQNNLLYFKENFEDIYNNITLFNTALETGQIKEKFSLEYKDDLYFDILDLTTNKYLYGSDSNIVTNKIVDNMNLDNTSNIFNTTVKNVRSLGNLYKHFEDIFLYIHKYQNTEKHFREIPKMFFLGTMLGMHIPKIIDKLLVLQAFIYEPNIEIFRLSLFTTKYYEIAKETHLIFSVFEDNNTMINKFRKFINTNVNLNYGIKFHNFSIYEDKLKDIMSTILGEQAFQFDFIYRLNLMKNSLINTKQIKNLNLSSNHNILDDVPVLLLAAGPSLEKNIKWIKENQDYFCIVSVGATNELLINKHDIIPDIIINVDGREKFLRFYDILEQNILDQLIFIGAAQVSPSIFNLFHDNNKFLFHNRNYHKHNLGIVVGASVGNILLYLTQIFKAKETYLIGLDMAYSDDGNSHISTHMNLDKQKNIKEVKLQQKNNITKKHFIKVKGNFKSNVLTDSLFYTYINDVANHMPMQIDAYVYNLSDGAYLKGTTPLYPKDIILQKKIDKTTLKNTLRNKLTNISINYSIQDNIDYISNTIYILKTYNKIDINSYDDIRDFFNEILSDIRLSASYRDLVLNFVKAIFHYTDEFLNDSSFSYEEEQQHIKNINKLLYSAFINFNTKYIETLSIMIG